jgi:hypothetical protein
VLEACELEEVRRLSLSEGVSSAWVPFLPRWHHLASLSLMNCNLLCIPEEVCMLPALEELAMGGNR